MAQIIIVRKAAMIAPLLPDAFVTLDDKRSMNLGLFSRLFSKFFIINIKTKGK